MKKAERLLKLLDLIRSDPSYTPIRLAKECGVSQRTIFRDISALTVELGVTVEYENGYKLDANADTPYAGLTPGELLAIRVAATSPVLSGTQYPHGTHLRTALAKISSALGDQAGRFAERLSQSVHIDTPAHPDTDSDGERLACMERCIRDCETVILTYRSLSSQKTSEYAADIYALTFRRHSWYVVVYSHRHHAFRTLKLRRIARVEPTGRRFQRNPDFSLEGYFAGSWELHHGDPVRVTAGFAPDIALLVQETRYHPSQTVTMQADGSALFSVTVAGTDEIERWLLGFGGDVEVLSPPELRQKMLQRGIEIAAAYAAVGDVLKALEIVSDRIATRPQEK